MGLNRNSDRRPYKGMDPGGDGQFYAYSRGDFVAGTDPYRNYGEPLWGDCDDDVGYSFLSGVQTYCGPVLFSEPSPARA